MITKMRGFTLIETLLALAILAVLSAAAVMVLQNVIRADGLTREKTQQIATLQRAFRQIADDVTHIIPRRARNSDTFFFAGRFQLQSDDWGLAFSRSGWPNPLGILPRSEIQNVSYRLRQQQLERLSFDQQDPLTGSQPTVRVLLREVGREKPATVKRMLSDIYRQNRTDVKGIRTKKYGIEVEVLGIYVFNDVIYMHTCISNDTNISFEVDARRFIVADRKLTKRTAQQQTPLEILRVCNDPAVVRGHQRQRTVFALPKLTISDDKVLLLEIIEKNGARHQTVEIPAKELLEAKLL